MRSIFLFPWISARLLVIGVITAPTIRYVVSIQGEMLYERLNSLMIFGRDGTSMVSVYMTSVAIELRIARVFQAELGILSTFLIVDDDDFSVKPVESDSLLSFLTSSNFYHAYR